MIREHRSREKLEMYYHRYTEEGVLDPNVHPWVAESWKQSREFQVGTEKMLTRQRLTNEELAEAREKNKKAIEYLHSFVEEIREFFQNEVGT